MMRLALGLMCNIVLWGCSGPNQTAKEDNSPVYERPKPSLQDTLIYSYQEVKRESEYLSGSDDDLDTTFYRIQFPKFAARDVASLTHDAIFIEGDTDPEEAAQAFVDAYNEFVEEESTTYIAAWVKDIRSEVRVNTPAVLSICTRFYEFTGGAHGHTVAIWSNFDVAERRRIALTDIVDEAQLAELTQIAESYFREEENLADSASLAGDYFFSDGVFALNDNFGLTKDALIFYYNEYEIKPYAQGSTTLRIPYDSIAEILSVKGRQYIESIK